MRCPFCNSTDLKLEQISITYNETQEYILCKNCNMNGLLAIQENDEDGEQKFKKLTNKLSNIEIILNEILEECKNIIFIHRGNIEQKILKIKSML